MGEGGGGSNEDIHGGVAIMVDIHVRGPQGGLCFLDPWSPMALSGVGSCGGGSSTLLRLAWRIVVRGKEGG